MYHLNNSSTRDLVRFSFRIFAEVQGGVWVPGDPPRRVFAFSDLSDLQQDAWYSAVTAIAMSANSGRLRTDLFPPKKK